MSLNLYDFKVAVFRTDRSERVFKVERDFVCRACRKVDRAGVGDFLAVMDKERDSGLPSYIIRQVAVKPPTLVVAVTYALPPSKPLRAVIVAVSAPSLSGVSVRNSLMSLPSIGVHHLIDQSTDLSGASTGITVAVIFSTRFADRLPPLPHNSDSF